MTMLASWVTISKCLHFSQIMVSSVIQLVLTKSMIVEIIGVTFLCIYCFLFSLTVILNMQCLHIINSYKLKISFF